MNVSSTHREKTKNLILNVENYSYLNLLQNPSFHRSEENSQFHANQSESKESYRNGRWHPTEHSRFVKACLIFGNNWKKVRKFVFILGQGVCEDQILRTN